MKWRSAWPKFHSPVILPFILKTMWRINIIIWDYESVWWHFDLKINVGHCDLYFMVQWFCHILKTLWCMNIILWDYESVWPAMWPQNKCMSLWPIFHGPVILPYILKTLWCINIWDYESVWPNIWPQNKCRSLWPIFHGPVILPYILKTLWTSYFGIMSQYDPTCDLKINVCHCDLYFMVRWFCLISWRLFDIWTPYFGIMSQYDPMFDLEINVGHSDLYFIVQWFCLISLYLMDECHTFRKLVSLIQSSDFSLFFALKNILVLLAKHDSGELRCPATALIHHMTSWSSNGIMSCHKNCTCMTTCYMTLGYWYATPWYQPWPFYGFITDNKLFQLLRWWNPI